MNEVPERILGSDEDGKRAINLDECKKGGLDGLYSRAASQFSMREHTLFTMEDTNGDIMDDVTSF